MRASSCRSISAVLIMVASVTLSSCAQSQVNKDVNQKLSAEPSDLTVKDVDQEARAVIQSADISDEQKQKLLDLRQKTQADFSRLRSESLKLRAVLIKEVVNPNYNSDEVATIKSRIQKVEKQRISTLFNAIDEANRILGRPSLRSEKLIRLYQEDPGEHRT